MELLKRSGLWLVLAIAWAATGADKSGTHELRIPIMAANGAVTSIQAGKIQARLNGVDTPIAGMRGPGDDQVLITVWDVAGDLTLVDAAKDAFVERVKQLPPNTYVAVMRASEGMQVISDPTGDRDAIASAIQNLPVTGKAGFLDTVRTAAELADSITTRTGVRSAVVYVTDSDVANYREDFTNPVVNSSDSRDLSRRFPEGLVREKISKLQQSLGAVQAPIFFVHLVYRTDRLNEAYQSGLMLLAQSSGGTGIFCRSTSEVGEAVRKTIDAAAGQYLAWVKLPPKHPRDMLVQVLGADGVPLTARTRFVVK